MPLFAFVCAAVVPVALWHHAIAAIAADFRLDPGYLTGWTGFGLIAVGLLLLVRSCAPSAYRRAAASTRASATRTWAGASRCI
jgi:hypothetical protein